MKETFTYCDRCGRRLTQQTGYIDQSIFIKGKYDTADFVRVNNGSYEFDICRECFEKLYNTIVEFFMR